LFIFDRRWTVRRLKIELFRYLRPLMPGFKGGNGKKKTEEE